MKDRALKLSLERGPHVEEAKPQLEVMDQVKHDLLTTRSLGGAGGRVAFSVAMAREKLRNKSWARNDKCAKKCDDAASQLGANGSLIEAEDDADRSKKGRKTKWFKRRPWLELSADGVADAQRVKLQVNQDYFPC